MDYQYAKAAVNPDPPVMAAQQWANASPLVAGWVESCMVQWVSAKIAASLHIRAAIALARSGELGE